MTRLRPAFWRLDAEVAHLNHGSFGAVPLPVLKAQARAALRVERSPERWYRVELAPSLAAVRAEVAAFLGAETGGLALVENATAGVAVVLDAVAPGPGRDVVLTDHAYPWVRAAVERACTRGGAVVRTVPVPLDDHGTVDGGALAQALQLVTRSGTALVVLDQITSGSALRMPLDTLLTSVGGAAPVLVDGAHAPGLIERPVPVGAAFWVGNLHKWAFAARTAAALVVAPAYRDRVRPSIESARAADGFPSAFDYLGTQDPSALLALPEALAFPNAYLGMSFADLRERNRDVLAEGLARASRHLPLAVGPDQGLPMRMVSWGREGDDAEAARWTARLRDAGVEVAVVARAGRLHARVSVQAYVGADDVERLGRALAELEADGR